ncbi:MAG: DUF4389 domain-containing protein [Dehalococcoidia bacterium]
MNAETPSPYPVNFEVEPQLTNRNRLTVAFRLILAIPHLLLVGGPSGIGSLGLLFLVFNGDNSSNNYGGGSSAGIIGIVIGIIVFISWFIVVFTAKMPRGLWDFVNFYMKWRANSIAYVAMLRDEYPPFGTGEYPVRFSAGEYPEQRSRLTVFFRLFLLIPHGIVLFFLGIAWWLTAIISWFAILFTGSYPESLYRFAVGYLRWSIRVEAYGFLMRDEYPPFSLD